MSEKNSVDWFAMEEAESMFPNGWEHFDLYLEPEKYQQAHMCTYGAGGGFLPAITDWRERMLSHDLFAESFFNNGYGVSFGDVLCSIIDKFKALILDGHYLAIGVSFGKDSSCLVVLFHLAVAELLSEGLLSPYDEVGALLHGDTGVESPVVSGLASHKFNACVAAYHNQAVPVSCVLGRPSFSDSFIGRVLSGRGLPSFYNSSSRDCTVNWKIKPNERALKRHLKMRRINKPVVLVLGSRESESSVRKSSIEKFGGIGDALNVAFMADKKQYVMHPIRNFESEHVWTLLNFSGDSGDSLIPSLFDFADTIEAYRDSAGECVMVQDNQPASSGCGARMGCFVCTAVKNDSSMLEFLSQEKYAYLKPLSRIREYIAKTHFRWSERNIRGRSINKYGYVKLQPDTYSFEKCRRLLAAMITADVVEAERAYEVEQALYAGEIEDTAWNRQMSKAQFQLVNKEDLIKLDYLWAFDNFSERSFDALRVYHEVTVLGKEEHLAFVDDLESTPQTPQPPAYWAYVGDWSDGGRNVGLVDYLHEFVSHDATQLRVPRTRTATGEVYETMAFGEAESITADPDKSWYVFDAIESYIDTGISAGRVASPLGSSMSGAFRHLREGVIELKKHNAFQTNLMARRSQWYCIRGIHSDLGYESFVANLGWHEQRHGGKIYTNREYRELVNQLSLDVDAPLVSVEQTDLQQFEQMTLSFVDIAESVRSEPKPRSRKVKAKDKPIGVQTALF